jgi:hypothetical protein
VDVHARVHTPVFACTCAYKLTTTARVAQESVSAVYHQMQAKVGGRVEQVSRSVCEQAMVLLLSFNGVKTSSDVQRWMQQHAEGSIFAGRLFSSFQSPSLSLSSVCSEKMNCFGKRGRAGCGSTQDDFTRKMEGVIKLIDGVCHAYTPHMPYTCDCKCSYLYSHRKRTGNEDRHG